MTLQEFQALAAQGYNRIPLVRQADAGLDTPLSAYLKLAAGPYSFLFESVQGGEKWGRYSLLGLPARTRIEARGDRTVVLRDGAEVARHQGNPLHFIEHYRQGLKAPVLPGLPRFTGGLVGCFGYDTVRYIEPRLAGRAPPDALGLPDIALMEADAVLVFDNLAGRLYLVLSVDPAEPEAWARGQARLDALTARLRAGLDYPPAPPATPIAESDFVPGFTQARFEDAVRRIQRYIRDGDVMQVVLSQRMSVPLAASSLDVYRALRALNPSPYLFHMDLGGFQVVGSSPEILTRLEEGVVTVRPIAGTRPRGRDEAQDRALEQELLADPKERAEHLMLIDLGRNDVGRISRPGSVRVTEQMVIERYSHVMHIVSNVTGRVRDGLTALDALAATFPAGTVSGAPKVRAMEIIDELEPVKRGVYAGAVGYIGYCGNMDTAIAIRTAIIQGGQLHIQAGAGVVADSDPAREWEETLNKGRAMFRAVSRAQAGG